MPSPDAGSAFALERTENFRPDGITAVQLEGGTADVVGGVRASVMSRGGLGALTSPPDAGSDVDDDGSVDAAVDVGVDVGVDVKV